MIAKQTGPIRNPTMALAASDHRSAVDAKHPNSQLQVVASVAMLKEDHPAPRHSEPRHRVPCIAEEIWPEAQKGPLNSRKYGPFDH